MLFVAGCDVGLQTRLVVNINEPPYFNHQLVLETSGEATETFNNPETVETLAALFVEHGYQQNQLSVTTSGDRFRFVANTPPNVALPPSGLSGVEHVLVEPEKRQITLGLVPPTQLQQSILEAVETSDVYEPTIVGETLVASMLLEVSVETPGPPAQIGNLNGFDVTTTKNVTVVKRRVENNTTGELTIMWDTPTTTSKPFWVVWLFLAVLVAAVFVDRHRKHNQRWSRWTTPPHNSSPRP